MKKKKQVRHLTEEFAPHPRYGTRPQFTGDNPTPTTPGVNLHWNATSMREILTRYTAVFGKIPTYLSQLPASIRLAAPGRIPETAIAADLSRQTPATVPVTHYFDIKRTCSDCKQPFIFYAREQKHWYEQLGFPLEADARRCVRCRKAVRAIARLRVTYELLLQNSERTPDENAQLLDALLKLIEQRTFTTKKLPKARAILKKIPEPDQQVFRGRIEQLEAR